MTSIFNGLEQKLGTLNEIRCGFLKYILQIHMCVCVLGHDVKGHGIKVATEKKLKIIDQKYTKIYGRVF